MTSDLEARAGQMKFTSVGNSFFVFARIDNIAIFHYLEINDLSMVKMTFPCTRFFLNNKYKDSIYIFITIHMIL